MDVSGTGKDALFLLARLIFLAISVVVTTDAVETVVMYRIFEEIPSGSFVGNIVRDYKLDRRYSAAVLATIRFNLFTVPAVEGQGSLFAVSEIGGQITTNQVIDRERVCPRSDECIVNFDVAVLPNFYFLMVKVRVEILDINDNPPRFPHPVVSFEIFESAEPSPSGGLSIPNADDLDSSVNGLSRYVLESPSDHFELSVRSRGEGASSQVRLVLKKSLDREDCSHYQLEVIAIDRGMPPLTGSVRINISVADVNDNSPEFDEISYSAHVPENAPVGLDIFKVTARDRDSGTNAEISYSFTVETMTAHGNTFGIRNDSGSIYTTDRLDYETKPTYNLYVIARDGGPTPSNTDSLSAMASVLVRVDDVNDNAPEIHIYPLTSPGPTNASGSATRGSRATTVEVLENIEVGFYVAHVSVHDADTEENGVSSCVLVNGKVFQLKRLYATEYMVQTTESLDRETIDRYRLLVYCADKGRPKMTSQMTFDVIVLDVNDNDPQFAHESYIAEVLASSPIGSLVVQTKAVDRDTGNNGRVVYRILPGAASVWTGDRFLSIDGNTGSIRISGRLDREALPLLEFIVLAEDQGDPVRRSGTASVTVRILDVGTGGRPASLHSPCTYVVPENQSPGFYVGSIPETVGTKPRSKNASYSLDFGVTNEAEPFGIDSKTGILFTTEELDRERVETYSFHVVILHLNTKSVISTESVDVVVMVEDENDNNPILDYPNEANDTVYLSRSAVPGQLVTAIQATDKDLGQNGNVTYTLGEDVDGNWKLFNIDHESGSMFVVADLTELDLETVLHLKLIVSDLGNPPLKVTGWLRVILSDGTIDDLGIPVVDQVCSILASDDLALVLSFLLAAIILAIFVSIALTVRASKSRNRKAFNMLSVDLMAKGKGQEVEKKPEITSFSLLGGIKANGKTRKQHPCPNRVTRACQSSGLKSPIIGSKHKAGFSKEKKTVPPFGRMLSPDSSDVALMVTSASDGGSGDGSCGIDEKRVVVFIREQSLDEDQQDGLSNCSSVESDSDSGRGPSSRNVFHPRRSTTTTTTTTAANGAQYQSMTSLICTGNSSRTRDNHSWFPMNRLTSASITSSFPSSTAETTTSWTSGPIDCRLSKDISEVKDDINAWMWARDEDFKLGDRTEQQQQRHHQPSVTPFKRELQRTQENFFSARRESFDRDEIDEVDPSEQQDCFETGRMVGQI